MGAVHKLRYVALDGGGGFVSKRNDVICVTQGVTFSTFGRRRYTKQIRRAVLTHYRPAMPFGNRKILFRGSFQLSIVTI